jgi:hypothetical protein
MEKDDVLRGRLHAAQIRQDQDLAGEVEQGASRSVPATPRGGVEEKPQEESSVEKTAVEEEDLLPEIGSGIGEGHRTKKKWPNCSVISRMRIPPSLKRRLKVQVQRPPIRLSMKKESQSRNDPELGLR